LQFKPRASSRPSSPYLCRATPSGAGKCYKVTMTALDNSTLSAFFKTK
jgi:hypothetical protein